MTKLLGAMILVCWLTAISYGGTPAYVDKSVKEAVAPASCPEWYRDTELNVTLWGTYAWASNDGHADINNFQPSFRAAGFNANELMASDRYLETDHSWGGGFDIKYFVRRYVGIGIEGFLVEAERNTVDITIPTPLTGFITHHDDSRIIGGALGTLTFRYPIRCSRLSPYVWAGGGGIFNGGERDVVLISARNPALAAQTAHEGPQSKALGQFGGGLEFRINRHLGWQNDFSWNIVDGPDNNFGMVRSGLTFSF